MYCSSRIDTRLPLASICASRSAAFCCSDARSVCGFACARVVVVSVPAVVIARAAAMTAAARGRALLVIRNMRVNTRRRRPARSGWPARRTRGAQTATGQPGVGDGSPRPVTMGADQCSFRAISSTVFCHSVGLHPCVAVWSCVSWRSITSAGSRSRPRLSTRARSGSHQVSHRSTASPRMRLVIAFVDGTHHDRAHVAVAERREDPVDHGHERRALGPVGQHDQHRG